MKSSTWAAALLDLEFTNANAAGLGDSTGLRGSSTAGSVYIALHTASPGVSGAQNANEATYTGYARVAVARDGSHWTRTGNSISPSSNIQFPTRSDNGAAQVLNFWSIGDAASGATVMRRFGAIGTAPRPFEALSSDTFYATAHAMSVNDQIVFWSVTDQALPVGITEGTVYFVKTVPDSDTFTISATQGGSTIDVTTGGAGRWQKVTGLSVTQGTIPILTTSTTIEEA